MSQKMSKQLIKIIISLLLVVISLLLKFDTELYSNILYVIAYIIVGYDIVLKAVRNIFKGKVFDENFLMTVATIGAFCIGEFPEAVAVMLFYQIGELFQSYAVDRSRKSVASLMDIRPDYANVYRENEIERVDPDEVNIGEIILVKPGEKIPLDGIVVDGESMLNTQALTGESVPRKVTVNDEVLSGCINNDGILKIKVSKEFEESTVSKILDLVENASSRKSKSENFISKFAKYYTPIVVIILFTVLAILSFLFRKDLKASPEKMAALMDTAQGDTITNRSLMIRSVFVLCLVVLGFLSHTAIGLETSVVALCGASILLLFEKPAEIFKEVEWNTIFFFIGLFIIVGGLEASGGIKMMANFLMDITKGSQEATSMIVLWASGMISGVIDNIPYTATMAPMILEIEKALGREYANPLWWSLSLGACLGGNMTIIGAAANVIVSERAAQNGWKISFMFFLKYGVLVTLISLALSAAYLYLRFFL